MDDFRILSGSVTVGMITKICIGNTVGTYLPTVIVYFRLKRLYLQLLVFIDDYFDENKFTIIGHIVPIFSLKMIYSR
jgi:hypothetical protein